MYQRCGKRGRPLAEAVTALSASYPETRPYHNYSNSPPVLSLRLTENLYQRNDQLGSWFCLRCSGIKDCTDFREASVSDVTTATHGAVPKLRLTTNWSDQRCTKRKLQLTHILSILTMATTAICRRASGARKPGHTCPAHVYVLSNRNDTARNCW